MTSWGFKDPRVCLFLDAWKYLLPEARVVAVYRNWSDATYSLERRHIEEMTAGVGSVDVHERFWTVPDLGLRMWIEYNRALLRFASAHPDDVVLRPVPRSIGRESNPGCPEREVGYEVAPGAGYRPVRPRRHGISTWVATADGRAPHRNSARDVGATGDLGKRRFTEQPASGRLLQGFRGRTHRQTTGSHWRSPPCDGTWNRLATTWTQAAR